MQHQGGSKDFAVGIQIERLRLQNIGDTTDGVRVQQDASQNRFLRLEVLGRNGIGQGLEAGLLITTPTGEAAASPFG